MVSKSWEKVQTTTSISWSKDLQPLSRVSKEIHREDIINGRIAWLTLLSFLRKFFIWDFNFRDSRICRSLHAFEDCTETFSMQNIYISACIYFFILWYIISIFFFYNVFIWTNVFGFLCTFHCRYTVFYRYQTLRLSY